VQKVGKGSSKQEEDKMKQIEESQADFDKLSQTLRFFFVQVHKPALFVDVYMIFAINRFHLDPDA
jgi:hypothetical protein